MQARPPHDYWTCGPSEFYRNAGVCPHNLSSKPTDAPKTELLHAIPCSIRNYCMHSRLYYFQYEFCVKHCKHGHVLGTASTVVNGVLTAPAILPTILNQTHKIQTRISLILMKDDHLDEKLFSICWNLILFLACFSADMNSKQALRSKLTNNNVRCGCKTV